ncbi:MAG: UDP-N-acetylmuramate dehydrogenase [Candidatus Gastranaerophilales bacterium]|nr:UDP-N-acetylmuramate dehydrogenase [Candidatus Gastranaerophilales bacterium]
MVIENNLLENYELKSLTTLKIGGNAQFAFIPENIEEMADIIKYCNKENKKFNIIGAGSNLLISSKGVDDITIITKNLKEIKKLDETRISAQCGVKSANFSRFVYDYELAGGEFLIGIPGSIGGAIYMNAGAHGQNIKDIIESVKILDLNSNDIKEIPFSELYFNYRSSIFSDKNYKILEATFNLPKGEKEKIKERMDFHVNYRAEHHPPLTEYSAGSTFRNPEGDYAANLLEKVGAKEYIENDKVRFSVKHANFLYNFNDATSLDVVRLMYKMWDRVNKEFNIKLHPEIKFIGNKTDEEIELWEIMTKL